MCISCRLVSWGGLPEGDGHGKYQKEEGDHSGLATLSLLDEPQEPLNLPH